MDYILSHQEEFVKPTDIKIALTLLGEGMNLSDQLCSGGSPYYVIFSVLNALNFSGRPFRYDRSRICRRSYAQETGVFLDPVYSRRNCFP